MSVWIVKVGGSLLTDADLPPALFSWLDVPGRPPCWLVPGGGALVDVVREQARRFALPEPAAHWLAIRGLDLNAHLLASLLPPLSVATELGPIDRHTLWAPYAELRRDFAANPDAALPENWGATSDSIAAWAAARVSASRLVLLKSVGDGFDCSVADAAARGWVDPCFPAIVGARDVELINARAGFRSCRLRATI